MRYWWVNHKQTSKYEVAGGFLWSPMTKSNGRSNRFYDNMRRASPGDLVVSFAHAKIRYVGLITSFAIPAPKPSSFDSAGEYWRRSGWLLPVKWYTLTMAVSPKDKLFDIVELLPDKYSPIHQKTGNGAQSVYLAEISQRLFDSLMLFAEFEQEIELPSFIPFPPELAKIDETIEIQTLADETLDSTVKACVIAARRGQGLFKERIYEIESGCRLTGVTTPTLLIASHIKPWRLCDSATERLDGSNGLLLAPHVDVLFDRGLITFEDNGGVKVSTRLNEGDLDKLGLTDACAKGSKPFSERQSSYLSFHREKVYLA